MFHHASEEIKHEGGTPGCPKKRMNVQAEAWLVEWTETEAGWGQRPDGAWYYATEEAATRDTDRDWLSNGHREKEKGESPKEPCHGMEFP